MPTLRMPDSLKDVSILWSKKEELEQWLLEEASAEEIQSFYRKAIDRHRDVIVKMLVDKPPPVQSNGVGARHPQEVAADPDDEDDDVEKRMEDLLLSMPPAAVSNAKLPAVLEREMQDFEVANAEPPIVQFSSPMYFCSLDDEASMTLDVIRIGNLSRSSCISYTTKDASAKGGDKFVKSSGRLTFPEGSNNEEISIDLISSKHFDTTTEFQVELLVDPAPENCTAGRYLYVTRVKVIDGNSFPTNKYSSQIKKRDIYKIPFWGLFMEYVKLNWDNAVVKRGTRKWLLTDLANSIYLLLQLFLNVVLVDSVLTQAPDGANMYLCGIALMLIVPFLLLHILDYRKTTWKVGGASRAMLQNCLLRKFLNYAEAYRTELKSADLMMAMTRDVSNVVHEGYIKVLALIGSSVDLFMVLIFQVLAPFVFDKDAKPIGYGILFVFPFILIAFLLLRRKITTHVISEMNASQDELVNTVDRTVLNYRLVADYGQRPFFESRFQKTVGKYNSDRTEANKVLTNNRYFSPWLTILGVAGYTIYGGMQVVDQSIPEEDRLSLGMFLANLSIIKTIGHAWGSIYKVLMDIEAIYPALMQCVDLINLPTDVPARKALNRGKRHHTTILREELRKSLEKGWPADNMPIMLDSLTYDYGHHEKEAGTASAEPPCNSGRISPNPAFQMNGELRFHQGEFTSLVGPAGEGKSTLLRMMGGVILPKPGSLFVPSHLRILHVATEPLFFKASLFDNLTFGCMSGDADGNLDRVLKICERLGIHTDLLDLVKQGASGPSLVWADLVSQTNKCLLAFARAVITNPELMCIHKPLMAYNEATSVKVLQMLKEYCVQKGVEQDPHSRHLRRPRTCLITAAKVASVRHADHVYLVSHKLGVRYIPKDLARSMYASAAEGLAIRDSKVVPDCSVGRYALGGNKQEKDVRIL